MSETKKKRTPRSGVAGALAILKSDDAPSAIELAASLTDGELDVEGVMQVENDRHAAAMRRLRALRDFDRIAATLDDGDRAMVQAVVVKMFPTNDGDDSTPAV